MEDQNESKNLETVNTPEVSQKPGETQGENSEDTTPKSEDKMFKHEIYDRLPFTYKGVDRFVKIMIGITIAILILAIATR
jgi:hypothetical protein